MKTKWAFPPLLLVLLTSCRLVISMEAISGSGFIVTQTRPVGGFDKVIFNGNGDISVAAGYTESLTVEADENLQRYITAEVVNRTLVLSVAPGVAIHPSRTVRYTVSMKNFTVFELNGQGTADLSGISTGGFLLKLAGRGDITASGSGTYNFMTVILSGEGTIDLSELRTLTTYATLSGFGDMVLWTTDYLNATLSGYGDINYWGNPYLDYSITGSGSVRWLGY